jgi:hypothetical protein
MLLGSEDQLGAKAMSLPLILKPIPCFHRLSRVEIPLTPRRSVHRGLSIRSDNAFRNPRRTTRIEIADRDDIADCIRFPDPVCQLMISVKGTWRTMTSGSLVLPL